MTTCCILCRASTRAKDKQPEQTLRIRLIVFCFPDLSFGDLVRLNLHVNSRSTRLRCLPVRDPHPQRSYRNLSTEPAGREKERGPEVQPIQRHFPPWWLSCLATSFSAPMHQPLSPLLIQSASRLDLEQIPWRT